MERRIERAVRTLNTIAQMKPLLSCALIACLLAGCDKSKPTGTPTGRPVAAPPPVRPASPAPTAATQPVPPTPTAEAGAAPAKGSAEAALQELIGVVRAYIMTQGKTPATLEDLVKAGLIPKLPTPPPGKKFVLDAKRNSVLLVNQ